MLRKLGGVLLTGAALAVGACTNDNNTPADSGPGLCSGVASPCVGFPAGTTASAINGAFASAAANTTFVFGPGTFTLDNTLSPPAVSGLKLTGAGIDQTILDFTTQVTGASGIKAADGSQNITFSNFTIKNSKGNGIDVKGGNKVYFQKVKVTWTNVSQPGNNGAYGLYPVSSNYVLVEDCQTNGASDTGIYVGQSSNIIVRNNYAGSIVDGGTTIASGNVAGIEIENSVNADVYGNTAQGNTGGILVFSLPFLHPPDAGTGFGSANTINVRVFNNTIHANNTINFADPAGTVAAVPGGTGLVVLAATNVEVYGNTISDNSTDAYSVVSTYLARPTYPQSPTLPDGGLDPNFDTRLNPFPYNVYAHNNTFSNNGTSPVINNATGTNQLGFLLFALMSVYDAFPAVPSLIWDGIAPIPPYVPPLPGADAGTPPNPLNYFIQANGSAVFANLNFPVLVPGGNPNNLDPTAIRFDAVDFTPTGTPTPFPLPAVPYPFP